MRDREPHAHSAFSGGSLQMTSHTWNALPIKNAQLPQNVDTAD